MYSVHLMKNVCVLVDSELMIQTVAVYARSHFLFPVMSLCAMGRRFPSGRKLTDNVMVSFYWASHLELTERSLNDRDVVPF